MEKVIGFYCCAILTWTEFQVEGNASCQYCPAVNFVTYAIFCVRIEVFYLVLILGWKKIVLECCGKIIVVPIGIGLFYATYDIPWKGLGVAREMKSLAAMAAFSSSREVLIRTYGA